MIGIGAKTTGRRIMRRGLTVAVGSGKGGVGKTSLVANLALSLAKTGLAVTVLDGDLGLANLDVLLGLVPKLTLEHFFREGLSLEEVAIEGPLGIRVIPAGSGIPELTQLVPDDLIRLVEGIGKLRETSDILLIDTAAGIAEGASRLWLIADHMLLVTWPEPTALVDAYAALKVLKQRRGPLHQVGIVVNGVADAAEAEIVHRRLAMASRKFLEQEVNLDGFIVRDEAVTDAARHQRAVVMTNPLCPASRCFERLALHVAALANKRMHGAVGQPWTSHSTGNELLH